MTDSSFPQTLLGNIANAAGAFRAVQRALSLQAGPTGDLLEDAAHCLLTLKECLLRQLPAASGGPLYTALNRFFDRVREFNRHDLEGWHSLMLDVECMLSDLDAQASAMAGGDTTRMQLLNSLIARFGFTRYLEIGCNSDECFNAITAARKVGVDPIAGGTVRLTSDAYFAQCSEQFDLIFIDGLHEARQVLRDVANARVRLSAGGLIVIHDCSPKYEVRQIVPLMTTNWNGDVWKALVTLRSDPELDAVVVDCDNGCGVLRLHPNSDLLCPAPDWADLTWDNLERNRQKWLRLCSLDELGTWLTSRPFSQRCR